MGLFLQTMLKLLMGHALADFALQSDTMAKGKIRHKKPEYLTPGQKYTTCWLYWLFAHALIHGGVVWIITSSPILGILETIFHLSLDGLTGEGLTTPHQDQLLHVATKFLYCVMLINGRG